MNALEGKRAAILIAEKFQDEEGVEPAAYLRERGAEVVYVGMKAGTVGGKYGRQEVEVDLAVEDADPAGFDLLVIPGGAAPEALRLHDGILAFTRHFLDHGKPVAAICHGPQILISAGVLAGRTVTCFAGIRDDVRLAGARYRDKAVVVDHNLVTSRTPADLPAFHEAMEQLLVPQDSASAPSR
jgi:protease I